MAGASPPEAPPKKPLTYAAAGVDIEKADRAKKAILKTLSFKRTGLGAPLDLPWGFAGAVDFGEHALVLCTDGVGTKVEVAAATNRWETIGIDAVAMNVNDALCAGAEPLALVDYIVLQKPDEDLVTRIAVGLNEGARQSNATIVGGETAILPELANGVDVSATCLGYAKKSEILQAERVRAGDVLIGFASSGLHSNGYTLARRILRDAGVRYDDPGPGGRTWGEILLEPTLIYVKALLALRAKVAVRGAANVTGGGLTNLSRMNRRLEYVLDEPFPTPEVFRALAEYGKVEPKEMWRTFNMGLGFVVAVADADVPAALSALAPHANAKVVGRVVPGSGVWLPGLDLRF
ncbi:MAG TPA: phosphoribosylformylglycinamidine cyclo-ligase [Candidatus Thermoplasmatota archaeon]|nr:phosphoribosylformylglycinamidine cyclo-ligase [Candidatus Thermoplasmatota archaeon]